MAMPHWDTGMTTFNPVIASMMPHTRQDMHFLFSLLSRVLVNADPHHPYNVFAITRNPVLGVTRSGVALLRALLMSH